MEQIRIAILNPYNKVLTFLDNTVPNAMHYFDEILHTYLKGSAYTFEFTTMTAHDDAAFLVEGNKLSFKRKDKGYHLTIMSVEKGGDITSVTAYGLCLELTNEYVDAYKSPRAMSFAEYVNAYGFEQSFTIGRNEVSNKKISHEWTGIDTDSHIPGGSTQSVQTVLNGIPSDFIRESATFYPNTTLKIRKAPTEKGIDTGLFYNQGMSVRYDGYVKREGFVWISWISASSGERRWMKAGVLNSNGYNTNPYGRFA